MPRARLGFVPVGLALIAACDQQLETKVTQVWAGPLGTCATTIDGFLWCWGSNVGDGTTNYHSSPMKPTGNLRNVTSVSIGSDATCAILDQRLLCWGAAGTGGDGSTLSGEPAPVPTNQAVLADPVRGVAAGAKLRCVVKIDGSAWCWGQGSLGLLGNDSEVDSGTPVAVTSMSSGVASILLGTYALKDDGSVWGWGPVYGANLNGGHTTVPIPILRTDLSPLTDVVQIDGGGLWACALTSDGRVLCWGQLPGSFERMNVDVAVEIDPTDIPAATVEIAVGHDSLCALDADGVVHCEGRNDHGQLGDNTRDLRFTMAPVQGLPKRATHITSGEFHTCAILEDQTLWCWGADIVDRLLPTEVRFGG